MSETTVEEHFAFSEGYNAYLDNVDENPYDRDDKPELYRAWADGRQQAAEDD